MRAKNIYGGRPPEELPAYTIQRAAQIVRVSPSTLRLWAVGDGAHEPLFVVSQGRPPSLSFNNLTEAFVLAAMRRVHGISMQKVRRALQFVGRRLGHSRPLLHAGFRTDGVSLFFEDASGLLNVSAEGQTALRAVLQASLKRIEWKNDYAVRLFPWVRTEIDGAQPKTIVVDPRRGFGQPVIAGTGVEARVVAARHRAGESIVVLARDYRVSLDAIEDAIRCETREAA